MGLDAKRAGGLVFSLRRQIPQQSAGMREGLRRTALSLVAFSKTLAIIGLEHLGQWVTRIARTFDTKMFACNQNPAQKTATSAGAPRVDKLTLLSEADVVALHLVLAERAHGIVMSGNLARTKPTVYLVNISRDPLVDETAH